MDRCLARIFGRSGTMSAVLPRSSSPSSPPILILFYFGMVEFCQGYMALKRTGHVARPWSPTWCLRSDSGDQDADLTDVFAIGDLIISALRRHASDPARQQRHARRYATTYKVDWSVE